MRIRIVTDSSTNIPDSYLAQLGIVEVPAVVNFGTESILNKVQLSTAEFYRRLANTEKMPTTAQPAPRQFADGYEQLAAEGAAEVIAVSVSGKMSGTLNSILNVKPLLSMVDGILEPVGHVRGRRRALAQMLDLVAAAIGDGPARLAVAHTNIAEEAARFLEIVKARFNAVETTISDLGPALGCFAGPGLMALAGYAIDQGGAQ